MAGFSRELPEPINGVCSPGLIVVLPTFGTDGAGEPLMHEHTDPADVWRLSRTPSLRIAVPTVASLLLGVLFVGRHSFWYDESFSVTFSQASLTQLWSQFGGEANMALYYVVLHFWLSFGDGEVSVESIIEGTWNRLRLGTIVRARNSEIREYIRTGRDDRQISSEHGTVVINNNRVGRAGSGAANKCRYYKDDLRLTRRS